MSGSHSTTEPGRWSGQVVVLVAVAVTHSAHHECHRTRRIPKMTTMKAIHNQFVAMKLIISTFFLPPIIGNGNVRNIGGNYRFVCGPLRNPAPTKRNLEGRLRCIRAGCQVPQDCTTPGSRLQAGSFRSKGHERSTAEGPSSEGGGPLALLKRSLDLSWLVHGFETDRCWR